MEKMIREIFGGGIVKRFWGQQGESLGVYDSFISCTKKFTLHFHPPWFMVVPFFIFLTNATARCLAIDLRKNTLGKG